MCSSSDREINFYYRNSTPIHPSVLNQLVKLDKDHFPTPWEESKWKAFTQTESQFLLGVSHLGAKIEGFILINLADPDTAHLLKILVHPENRKSQVATRLMRGALEIIQKTSHLSMFLEVEQTNFEALEFYRKHGFIVLTAKKDFYGTMRDAWAMELRLQ